MKVTEINIGDIKVTVNDPQSQNQREMLEKACTDFFKAVEENRQQKHSAKKKS